MYYIQLKTNYGLETIDEFDSYKKAKTAIKEYRDSYKGMGIVVYISTRACKDWRERD